MKLTDLVKVAQLTFLIVVVMPIYGYAAPSISSTSGTVSHGQTVTVNGSGFGTKTTFSASVTSLKYDPVDGMYSGLSNGANVPFGGSNPWPDAPEMEYTSKPSVGYKTSNPRGKITAHYSNQWVGNTGKANLGGLNFGTSVSTKKWYMSWWMWNSATLCPSGNSSNKYIRVTDDAGWNNPLSTLIWEPNGESVILYSDTGGYTAEYGAASCNAGGGWQRMEVTIDNTSISPMRVNTYVNNALLQSANGNLPQKITGIYTIGFDASNSDGAQPIVDFGEIYVDDTVARVEVCNASTKANSNHCEIQIPQTTWIDGQLQIKVNQGSFADGATAYLYVLDSSGTANLTGYSVTFGSSNGYSANTAPSPPQNPKGVKQ